MGTPYGSTLDLTASNGSAELAGHFRTLRRDVQSGDWKGGGGGTIPGSGLAGTADAGGVGTALSGDWPVAAVASTTYASKPHAAPKPGHPKTSLRDLLQLGDNDSTA